MIWIRTNRDVARYKCIVILHLILIKIYPAPSIPIGSKISNYDIIITGLNVLSNNIIAIRKEQSVSNGGGTHHEK